MTDDLVVPGRPAAHPVVLAGVGHYFPGEPVTNGYFENLERLDVDDAWIRRNTGVVTRHWPSDPNERHVEMGVVAARMALADAGLDVDDVGLVIGTTATARPRTNPSSAGNNYMDISLPLQHQLGVRNAFCLDVTAVACAGFLYGSVTAQALMNQMGVDTALVVCAESPERILNFRYRNSALFGGGAAAAVWRRAEEGAESGTAVAVAGRRGLIDATLRADGTHFDAFDIDDGDKMIMDGKLVGRLGPQLLIDAAQTILKANRIEATDVDWLVPHQGNINMVNEVAGYFGIPRERVLLNISRRGNTSSVGIPSCLSEHVHDGTIRPGELLLSVGIGRGFSWGAMLYTYK